MRVTVTVRVGVGARVRGRGSAPLAAARIQRSMVLVDARARAVSWRKGTPALISCAVAHLSKARLKRVSSGPAWVPVC